MSTQRQFCDRRHHGELPLVGGFAYPSKPTGGQIRLPSLAVTSHPELGSEKPHLKNRTAKSAPLAGLTGYSLVELMIVVLLTAILSAAGLEIAGGIVKRHRLQSGCEIFVSAVERARSLAVVRNGSFEIRIHPSRKSFAVAPTLAERPLLWRDLPRGVEFRRFPRREVTFHSRGAAAPAGSFSLASAEAEIRVVVAVSGRIRWEPIG